MGIILVSLQKIDLLYMLIGCESAANLHSSLFANQEYQNSVVFAESNTTAKLISSPAHLTTTQHRRRLKHPRMWKWLTLRTLSHLLRQEHRQRTLVQKHKTPTMWCPHGK